MGGICIFLCIHDTFHGLEPLAIVGWRAWAQFVNWKWLAHQGTFEMGVLWLGGNLVALELDAQMLLASNLQSACCA